MASFLGNLCVVKQWLKQEGMCYYEKLCSFKFTLAFKHVSNFVYIFFFNLQQKWIYPPIVKLQNSYRTYVIAYEIFMLTIAG